MTIKIIDAVLSPGEELPEADSWLVIDILRATTTMDAFFSGGGEVLYPCPSIEEAFVLRDKLSGEGRQILLMGEQNALPPPGFDLGNSPLELLKFGPSKRPEAVMATTNGTSALLKAARSDRPVRPVCARNAGFAARAAREDGGAIGILCAGLHGRSALDDAACAGLLVEMLLAGGEAELGDGARMALDVWRSCPDMERQLRRSVHGQRLIGLGFEKDLVFASAVNSSETLSLFGITKSGDPAIRRV